MDLTLRDVMTPSPHTIGEDQPLAKAHELMRVHAIRHLPVLKGGRLTGLVSLRDLHFIETLKDVEPGEVMVSEAMSLEPFAVDADTPLLSVAETMAATKHGSAVALERGHVVGVFTTVDAMRTLADLLRRQGGKTAGTVRRAASAKRKPPAARPAAKASAKPRSKKPPRAKARGRR